MTQLAVKLKQASQEERIENMFLTLKSLELLIIDEWGYTAVKFLSNVILKPPFLCSILTEHNSGKDITLQI